MGIDHCFDRQRGVVFVVWDGPITWDDWREHVNVLLSDPDWPHTPRFIVDLQSVTDTSSIKDHEILEVRQVFTSDPAILAGKRTAVVASEQFRRASRFAELVERFGASSIVFNNLDTACLFLGIDLDEARQTLERLRAELRSRASKTQ